MYLERPAISNMNVHASEHRGKGPKMAPLQMGIVLGVKKNMESKSKINIQGHDNKERCARKVLGYTDGYVYIITYRD